MKEFIVEDWDGKDIYGKKLLVTVKKDGMLLRRTEDGRIVTKGGKQVYNLPNVIINPGFEYAELFCGSWGKTMSIARASKSPRRPITVNEIYPLHPIVDNRLTTFPPDTEMIFDDETKRFVCTHIKSNDLKKQLEIVLALKHEGLVVHDLETGRKIKVKPKNTVDIKVLGIVRSRAAAHYGMLKEFITEAGAVGVGLTREQRQKYMTKSMIGKIIEVEVIGGYTSKGKFRSAKFIRVREDKS